MNLYIYFFLIGNLVKGFIGLCVKMYFFIIYDEKWSEVKKVKGVFKFVVNKEFLYELYLDCFFSDEMERY